MEAKEKREQILEAALAVFSRKGVFATRIADIANEAGIAYGLVYHYFKNKEEILNTIFEDRWMRIRESFEEANASGRNARDRLERVAQAFIDAYLNRPQVVELLLLEFTRMSKFLEPVQIEHIAQAYSVVSRIIERGQKDDEIVWDGPPTLLMLMYMGALQVVLQARFYEVFEPPAGFDRTGAETVMRVFMDGVGKR